MPGLFFHTRVRRLALLLAALISVVMPHALSSALPSPPTGDPNSSWSVVRGEASSWQILPDQLECTISQSGPHWILSKSPIEGDFVIEAKIGPTPGDGGGILFSVKSDRSYGYLLVVDSTTSLYRVSGSDRKLVTSWPLAEQASGSQLVRVVKKGTTYRVEVGGRVLSTITNPGGDRTAKPQPTEPDGGYWGFEFNSEGKHTVSNMRGFAIPRAKFLSTNPVVEVGPKGSWDQSAEAFASAVFEDKGKFYLYYSADYDRPPNGIQEEPLHRIGVATSTDLQTWKKYEKNPILGPPLQGDIMKFFDLPPSYVFATMQGGGGAVRLPNGHFGLTFNVLGWNGKGQWLGVWLAEAVSPLGPFHKVQPGPILTLGGPVDFDGTTIHLHGTQKLEDGSYAMLYTGYNKHIAKGKPGDRGGLATSKDMVHWTKYAGNPVLVPGDRKSVV